MSKPSVLFLITRSDAIGGAHIHVRDMAAALRGMGVDASVAVGGDGPYLDRLRERDVPMHRLTHMVRPLRPLHDTRAVAELVVLLRRLRPTLVSAHSSKAGLLARVACRIVGVPVVFTAHGWAFTDGVGRRTAWVYRQAERFAGRLADRIITVSHFDRRLALSAGVGTEANLRTVHNGMPLLARRAAARVPKPDTVVQLVMTARLDDQKDHRTLFIALAQLKNLPWQLSLIGEGPLLQPLQQLAASLGIAERIAFLGLRNDVEALLAAADVFLLITNWEGFPRSILEGMRAGLPVVATDVAGVSESVLHEHTGYLVGRGDVAALAKRLHQLILDPHLRQELGGEGRARFAAEFTFDQMLTKTYAVYDEVMTQRSLPIRFCALQKKSLNILN